MSDTKEAARENARRIAEQFAKEGDSTGWFDALYREADGNSEHLPWGDLEPNKFLVAWAEKTGLNGDDRTALVVGCGLGDDARYLHDLGFKVTAFDISATAIEWAKRLHPDADIGFVNMDLFDAPREFYRAFEFVLEVYTIQPLPLEARPSVIDAIANFVAPGGHLLVVTRGRADDDTVAELPWPLSRNDLSRFEVNGLRQIGFEEMYGDDSPDEVRFVVEYERPQLNRTSPPDLPVSP